MMGRWRLLTAETRGYCLGAIAVVLFSLTIPLTRLAVEDLAPTIVGLGRIVVAACLAGAVLLLRREPVPDRAYWPRLIRVALGVLVAFPLLTALALQHVPSAHGAVISGIQPAGTAIFAAIRAREHPPKAFWLAVGVGVATVLIFATVQGAGHPQAGDGLLLLAMVASTFSHVEAGKLAREIGGWRVISWALVFAGPILAIPVAVSIARNGLAAGGGSWLAFFQLAVFSAYLGFFPWYRGMNLAGIARIGQLQLAQPVLTLLWAVLLINEDVGIWTVLASLLVIGSVILTRRAWRPIPVTAGAPREP